jgi:hypothetical protein
MTVIVRFVGVIVTMRVIMRVAVRGRGIRGRFCCLHAAIIRGVPCAR